MRHILILEDSKLIQKIYQIYLMPDKYTLTLLSNGSEGLNFLQKGGNRTPDLIILDLEMPVLDGDSFLKSLKSLNRLSKIPVLICSSLPATSNPDSSRPFLMKPFGPQELISTIDRLIS